ncbi:MAG: YgiQ family radical SAM protein [Deltaproteobacteria bacterium]|nr:YgiQ family radical SAM protein [Deltaproteobacteria bacterium]
MNRSDFLPVSTEDLVARGYLSSIKDFDPSKSYLDVIIITGDAYVDHPSFGAAIIGRWIEHLGYRVGIISQPDWKNSSSLAHLGRPALFAAVTAGNLDSMLHHYTATIKLRHDDPYTPGGKHGARPNRATIVYAGLCRQIWKNILVIAGGIEVSGRLISHYDYWSDSIKGSILADSKVDMLIYGNAETQLKELLKVVERHHGSRKSVITDNSFKEIPGTAVFDQINESGIELPPLERCVSDKEEFVRAFNVFYKNQNPWTGRILWQKHLSRWVRINPPAAPIDTDMLDEIYSLPFSRTQHIDYQQKVPALETVRWSITIHRGCFGGCHFCSIYVNQGGIIQSRSKNSIIREVEILTKIPEFKGVITDLGGPSANMYKMGCKNDGKMKGCSRKGCLMPKPCKFLDKDHSQLLDLYTAVSNVPGVKRVFIASGIRFDLCIDDDTYISQLLEEHVGGLLKIAPEHTEDDVLRLMNKPQNHVFLSFLKKFRKYRKNNQFLVPYVMSSHPGCTFSFMINASRFLKKEKLMVEQAQDFIPLPSTVSSVMFYTGVHPFTGEKLFVERTPAGKLKQRYTLVPPRNSAKAVRRGKKTGKDVTKKTPGNRT